MPLFPFLDCILIPPYRWILDVYYPLTWVSKPKGQVLYVLSVMIFQCGTFGHNVAKYCLLYLIFFVGFAVAWCYITPIACWWISTGAYHQSYRRIFRFSWTVAACLLTQIVIRKCLSFHLLPIKLMSQISNYHRPAYNPHNFSTYPSGPKRSSGPSPMQVQPCHGSFTTTAPQEPIHGDAFPKCNYEHTLCAIKYYEHTLCTIKYTPTTIRLESSNIIRRESSRERRAKHTAPSDPRAPPGKSWDRSLHG